MTRLYRVVSTVRNQNVEDAKSILARMGTDVIAIIKENSMEFCVPIVEVSK